MLRTRANEIPELVRRLGSRKPTCVDAARARLSILGPLAVDDLIEALEGDNHRIRSRVMPILALIQDSRALEPLTAMLLDRSGKLREIAARSLARFPSEKVVAALHRVLQKERSEKVKIAAVHGLVQQYAAGQDQALCRVLELLSDPAAPVKIRLAAFSLLPRLRSSVRRSMLARLQQDPDKEVRRTAELTASGAGGLEPAPASIEPIVADLASDDYGVWNQAVHQLAHIGPDSIDPLLAEMDSRAHDPEYCKRAGMALKALGPRRGRRLADALSRIEEPLPLQVLVEVIGAFGEKSLIYRLKDLIDRLARRPTHPGDANGWDPMQRVRAQAHLELARIGSRVAVADLREALGDPDRRISFELIEAVQLNGKRDEIGLLLGAYAREDEWVRARIADAVRTILRRERIRRNNRMLRELGRDELRALNEILPRRRPKRVAGPGRRAAESAPSA